MSLQKKLLCLALASSFVSAASHAADNSSDVGRVTVEGAPGGTDTGLIQQEDSAKARSSVNRDFISKQAPTSNPFMMLNLLPGVNAYSFDPTGLFGGGLRVRGFNSDQLGFTIDGAPVNDSGNFAVFPQEYTDSECIDNIFVTQGSTDIDAPHIGATGGNIGITTITPSDTFNVRAAQTIGSNSLTRTFGRFDTGKVMGGPLKNTFCVSKTRANKFKGPGGADRDHFDYKGQLDLGGGNKVSAGLLFNNAINANIRALNKSQISLYGTKYDFGNIPPVHQPFNGTKINDPTYAPNVAANITSATGAIGDANAGYYNLNINPFRNLIATANANFKVAQNAVLTINPYFWYGYGTGGNELKTQTDSVRDGTKLRFGVAPFYSPTVGGDVLYVYNGSVTETYRPGGTVKLDADWNNQHFLGGIWYERARHIQTGTYVNIDNAGHAADLWMRNSDQYLLYNDGTPVQSRNYKTISTGQSLFLQDTIGLMQDKLSLVLGIADRQIKRDFTNTASSLVGGGADYTIDRTYKDTLPNIGLRYQLDKEQSLFANAAKNFKAPANFVLSGLLVGGTFVNGVLTGATLRQPTVDKETSNNFDLGYRWQSDRLTFSGTAFYIDFKNRIATSFDPTTALTTDQNVGSSRNYGAEGEIGYKLAAGWSLYSSLSLMQDKIEDSLIVVKATNGSLVTLPTKGNFYPDSPKVMAGLQLQYDRAGWNGFIQSKYTGSRFTTLLNDDSIPGYWLWNLGGGYTFQPTSWFKSAVIRFNVFNVFNSNYLNLNSGSGSSFTNNATAYTAPNGATVAANLPQLYVSPPRTYSLTLQADF
jgi:iron complex outermembrane receptor protein